MYSLNVDVMLTVVMPLLVVRLWHDHDATSDPANDDMKPPLMNTQLCPHGFVV